MNRRRFVARQRRRAAYVAWRVALGPISGGTPRRYIRSIVQRSWESSLAEHVEDATVVSDAQVERYEFGRSLPPRFRPTRGFDVRHLYTLRNVCVSPTTGLAWLPLGPILEESVGSLSRLLAHERWMLEEPLIRPERRVEGTSIVLAPVSYYHWVLEALPRVLQALAAEPGARLVVPTVMPRYADETLELIGHPDVLRTDEPILVERLVLVAREQHPGWIRREDIELVRAALLPKVASRRQSGEAIYVSRRLARRSPLNEAELERRLSRLGFDVVTAENLSFAEQIELFAGACVIAGAHGAGFTNLVFSRSFDHLVELFVVDHFSDCYARLAAQVGGTYADFYCTGPELNRSVAPLEAIEAALGRRP